MFKIGDLVVVIGGNYTYTLPGSTGRVVEADFSGSPRVLFDALEGRPNPHENELGPWYVAPEFLAHAGPKPAPKDKTVFKRSRFSLVTEIKER